MSSLPQGRRVEVHVSTCRPPVVGDKLSTRAAQKGVISCLIPHEDCPFSLQTGSPVDLYVSPLSLTSRMTMSSLIEALTGKTVAVTGDMSLGVEPQTYREDNRVHVDRMGRLLAKHGFSSRGTETFVCGKTGQLMDTPVMTGIVTYARLCHLASKKLHARATGPRDAITRQAVDGRKRGGGLRVGSMESSGIAAHGACRTLQTRYCELADGVVVYVCSKCKNVVDMANPAARFFWCTHCLSGEHILCTSIPYTVLLTRHELYAIGIDVLFGIEKVQ